MNTLALAQHHLGIAATTDARDKRERSSAIAVAAAAVAQAEAVERLCAILAPVPEFDEELIG